MLSYLEYIASSPPPFFKTKNTVSEKKMQQNHPVQSLSFFTAQEGKGLPEVTL